MVSNFHDMPEAAPRHDILIRGEILSADRLEQEAENLAATHKVAKRIGPGRPLEDRLKDNDRLLRDVYHAIARAIGKSSEISPAAEWLIDNYFVLEEQIRDILNDLPPNYYRQLPKLAEGPLAGYPRVYEIALSYIAHTDSFFNPDLLERFVRAYQRKTPLNISELWAVTIALRIALVENLRRAASLMIEEKQARFEADDLADKVLRDVSTADGGPGNDLLKQVEAMPFSAAYAVQLIHRLRDQSTNVMPIIRRLEEKLRVNNISAEEIVRIEHQNQGALTVTVRNIITSMRLISAFNWVEFFEAVSLVNEHLRFGSNYGAMDFPTRNLYRRAIEQLAARSPHSELEIADLAVKAVKPPDGTPRVTNVAYMTREQDPGYVLIGKGRPDFEKSIGYRPTWRDRMARAHVAFSFAGYLIANIILVTLFIELGLAGSMSGSRPWWVLAILAAAAFFPAWEAAITLVNRLVTRLFPTFDPSRHGSARRYS